MLGGHAVITWRASRKTRVTMLELRLAASTATRSRMLSLALSISASALCCAAAAATAQPTPKASASRATIGSVSNPPANAPRTLQLRITGGVGAVDVYASPGRALVKGNVRLTRHATVRNGDVTVKVPSSLPAGVWFIVVCPARATSGCGASHQAMLKAPSRLSMPVSAAPVGESAHAASATIGSAGGTLSATAADGTKFRLDMPSGSVPDGTQITMTPVSSLSAAPWTGKLVGAVQFTPDGLPLVHGATLTITPKSSVPIANQVAFGYGTGGADLHVVPLAPTRSSIEVPLAHFSGAGVGNAPGGASTPTFSSTTDAYWAQLGAIVQQWREGNLSQGDMETAASSVLGAVYKQIMANEVPAGLNDDTAAHQAIGDLLQYAKAEELLTPNDSALKQITPTLGKLLEGTYTRAQARCAQQHDFSSVGAIMSADRGEQLLGLDGHGLASDFSCLHFKVRFDSTITDNADVDLTHGLTGSYTLDYVAQPQLSVDLTSLAITGSVPGSYAQAEGTMSNPSVNFTSTLTAANPGTFTVAFLCIAGFQSAGCSGTQTSIAIDPGTPTETYQISGAQNRSLSVSCWFTGWFQAHMGDLIQSMDNTFLLSLQPGSGDLVGSGTWSQSTVSCYNAGRVSTEDTTIDVYHTPGD